MRTSNRILELDMLRGFAIIMMVIGHSFIIQPFNIHDVPWCICVKNWIYTYHMELFFLISGCVFKCDNYTKYIKNKVERILVPYVFFGVITLLLHAVPIGVVNRHISVTKGIVDMLVYGGNYWFLYCLFVIFTLYPLVAKLLKSTFLRIALIICCALFYRYLPHVFLLSDVGYYLPYFMMGVLVKPYLQKFINVQWYSHLLFILFGLSLYWVLYNSSININYVEGIIRFFKALSMCAILLSMFSLLMRINISNIVVFKNAVIKVLRESSKYSLQIYLFNGFCLVALRTVICSLFNVSNPILIVFGIVAGNLVISICLCKYVIPKVRRLSWICGLG